MATAKNKTRYHCSTCGHEEPKWLGRCPECGSWNSFREIQGPAAREAPAVEAATVPLGAIETREALRFDAGLEELNRVLGGGVMKGSATLIAGEPGTGKSTLMLQLAAEVQTPGRVLYVSGEESPGQIRLRSERLGITAPRPAPGRGRAEAGGAARLHAAAQRIEVFSGTELSAVLQVCDRLSPVVLIVDSIQTLHSADIGAVPGTVNQVKLCAQELIDWAKLHGAALFLVGHVTKEGYIAGPKVVEHMVDTVLHFETGSGELRLLRCAKNRFGAVDEIGIFQMGDGGLSQVQNPAALFLTQRQEAQPPGVVAAPVYEGSRVLLVEIQSLVVPAKGGISRVFSERIDAGRVSRMAAVLERHLKVRLSDQDIYVNVGGGIRIGEVGIELPLAACLYSARLNQPVPPLTAVVGEVSLAGEIHPVSHLERRIRAVQEMAFRRLIHPPAKDAKGLVPELCLPAASVGEALRSCFAA